MSDTSPFLQARGADVNPPSVDADEPPTFAAVLDLDDADAIEYDVVEDAVEDVEDRGDGPLVIPIEDDDDDVGPAPRPADATPADATPELPAPALYGAPAGLDPVRMVAPAPAPTPAPMPAASPQDGAAPVVRRPLNAPAYRIDDELGAPAPVAPAPAPASKLPLVVSALTALMAAVALMLATGVLNGPQVDAQHIAAGAVSGEHIADGSVASDDISPQALKVGPAGPAGPEGARGETGPEGPQGKNGKDGKNATVATPRRVVETSPESAKTRTTTAKCATGTKLIGGGARVDGTAAMVLASTPNGNAWEATATPARGSKSTFSLTVTALCAR